MRPDFLVRMASHERLDLWETQGEDVESDIGDVEDSDEED